MRLRTEKENSCEHEAKINFEDLTPYLTYALDKRLAACKFIVGGELSRLKVARKLTVVTVGFSPTIFKGISSLTHFQRKQFFRIFLIASLRNFITFLQNCLPSDLTCV
jgi:hypothetical protein